ncbi:MAG: hypothetical protein V4484_08240 [Pseudomonadota bacterium]
MKKIIIAIALAMATLGTAQAQTDAPAAQPMRFMVGMGLTGGGDRLGTAHYISGYDASIHAGGAIDFNAGIDYRINSAASFQGTVGYHSDRASARNGDMHFSRIPMELLAYYNFHPQWRIGAGVRYVSNAAFRSSGAAYAGNIDYKNTVSPLIEAEFMMKHWGFKARVVNEQYEEKLTGKKVDGDHVGLFGTYYF